MCEVPLYVRASFIATSRAQYSPSASFAPQRNPLSFPLSGLRRNFEPIIWSKYRMIRFPCPGESIISTRNINGLMCGGYCVWWEVPRKARIQGSQTCVSLNTRLGSNKEEERRGGSAPQQTFKVGILNRESGISDNKISFYRSFRN